eukprot:evm.model.scf_1272.5 EVM.evm.TU.scf_1272.5   scf_1272:24789-27888(-)
MSAATGSALGCHGSCGPIAHRPPGRFTGGSVLCVLALGPRAPRGCFQGRDGLRAVEEGPSGSRRAVLGTFAGSLGAACADWPFDLRASAGAVAGTAMQASEQADANAVQRVKEDPPTYVNALGRIVAVGDLHGDVRKAVRSLELAGVLREDENGRPLWCGGDTTVVQMGDVLDRGDCEIGIIMLLRDLHQQAQQEGGAVYMLNGNHETLNVCGNFRYVTRGAFYESALAAGLDPEAALVWDQQLIARVAMYSPGGILSKELAKNPTVLVVNDTVFAHGGLLPVHLDYGLEKINAEMAAWMRGDEHEDGKKITPPYIAMGGPQSILWNRTLGQEVFNTQYERYHACSMAKTVLSKLDAKRLVVGHTPQMSGCNCECGGQIWRVDVGMSRGVLNAGPEVLEIEQDYNGVSKIQVLRSEDDGSRSRRRFNGAIGLPRAHSKPEKKWKFWNFEWVSKETRVQIEKIEVETSD